MTIVVICAFLTAGTLFFVFRPLLQVTGFLLPEFDGGQSSLKRLLRRKEIVYENIKDLEFEYKMGKLGDDDYQRLRAEYEQEAYGLMQEMEHIVPESLEKGGQPQIVAVLKGGKKTRK